MINTYPVKRGEIHYIEIPDAYGSEQGGYRPALIIQNNIGNKHSPTTLVAPLTTSTTKHKLPTHVYLDAESCRLKRNSTVLLEQIRVVDKSRLKGCIAQLDSNKMREIDKAISISFGIGTVPAS